MRIAKMTAPLSAVVTALAIGAAPAAALDLDMPRTSIEAGVSTLGTFVAPSFALTDQLSLRAPLHFGGYAGNDSYNGNPVRYDLDLRSNAFMIDYHPFSGGLRLSGGLGFGGYEATTTVTDPELGEHVFEGRFDFSLEQKKTVAPVLAVGFVQPISGSMAFVGEIGGKFAQHELRTDLEAVADPVIRRDLAGEVAAINDDLRTIRVIPFLTVGARFSF